MAKNNITLVGGLDVGNGYTKGVILGVESQARDQIDIPSSVKFDITPAPKQPYQAADLSEIVNDDFYNALDAQIDSRQVTETGRLMYGLKSLQADGTQFVQFDIEDVTAKADQDLYPMIVLGMLAAKAVKDWAAINTGKDGITPFPDQEIVAEVYVGLALPIREYEVHHRTFARKFTGEGSVPANHVVTVRNFEEPIRVRLVFKLVTVDPEGGAAHSAIKSLGTDIVAQMIADNKVLGVEVAEGVTPETVAASLNTIGIDIGEGTVNFPVFKENNEGTASVFNSDAAGMLDQGYGTVMENALRLLDTTKYRFQNRKALANFIQRYERNPQPQHRAQYEAVEHALRKVTAPFINQLVQQYTRVQLATNNTNDVVYVYGGGSGPKWIHEELRRQLDKTETLVPVFYLDAQYSRNLNRHGLFIAAQQGLASQSPAKHKK